MSISLKPRAKDPIYPNMGLIVPQEIKQQFRHLRKDLPYYILDESFDYRFAEFGNINQTNKITRCA